MSQLHEVDVVDDAGANTKTMKSLMDLDDVSLIVPWAMYSGAPERVRMKFKGCEVWVVLDMTYDEAKALMYSKKINGIMMS